jgi:membrane associated rhomboid family serine protease
MGLHDRDYMRNDTRFAAWRPYRVTVWIIVINALLWFVYAGAVNWGSRGPLGVIDRSPGLAGFIHRHLVLHSAEVFGAFKLWQPFTAMWLHAPSGVGHVFWNMLLLFFFGRDLEVRLGSRRYLKLYLGGGLASTLAFVGFGYLAGHGAALGASGAVYAVMVWIALAEPQRTIYLFFVLPVPLWAAVGLFMVGGEAVRLASDAATAGAAVGHLAGAAWGLFFFRAFRGYGGELTGPGAWMVRLRRRRAAGRALEEDEAAEARRARVDRLLAKISAEGIGALSEEEKAFLQEASKRYK